MGNTNEKEVIEHIARSPAVQRVVHQTAIQIARILSASVIEMCKQMIDRPVSSNRSGNTTIYGSVHIHIHTQNMDVTKYEQRMKQAMSRASRKLDEAVEDAEIIEQHKMAMAKMKRQQASSQVASDQKWMMED